MACVKQVEEEVSEADAYANEPQRHPALKVHTQTPFNAETPLHIIESQDVTPVEMHFKRHHLPVPLVEVRKDRGRGGGVSTKAETLCTARGPPFAFCSRLKGKD